MFRKMKYEDAGSPLCDLCTADGTTRPAKYDEPIRFGNRKGTWAYTCEDHHLEYGLGNEHCGTEFTS